MDASHRYSPQSQEVCDKAGLDVPRRQSYGEPPSLFVAEDLRKSRAARRPAIQQADAVLKKQVAGHKGQNSLSRHNSPSPCFTLVAR